MLTGDVHGSAASNIPADGSGIPKLNAPSVMTEFVGPSITSVSPAQDSAILSEHAKLLVAVPPAKVRVEDNYVCSVKALGGGATTAVAMLETASGANRIMSTQS